MMALKINRKSLIWILMPAQLLGKRGDIKDEVLEMMQTAEFWTSWSLLRVSKRSEQTVNKNRNRATTIGVNKGLLTPTGHDHRWGGWGWWDQKTEIFVFRLKSLWSTTDQNKVAISADGVVPL